MADVQTQDGFLRSAGILLRHGEGSFVARLPLTPTLCHHPRILRVGALAMLADCSSGLHAVNEFAPEWPVTADLSLHTSAQPVHGDWVTASSRLLKRRRSGAVFETVVDDDGDPGSGPLATAALTFTTLSRPDPSLDRDSVIRFGSTAAPTAAMSAPLEDLLHVERAGAGLEMTIQPEHRNAFGAVAGGVLALLAELEAEAAVEASLGAPAVATSLTLYFLAPARVGPLVTTSGLLGRHPGARAATVSVLDAGAGDRPVVDARFTFHRRHDDAER